MVQVNTNTNTYTNTKTSTPVPSHQPINLRFRFRKTGRLMYISHLDLVRTFGKIVIRSRLPLWFTEGFNPKPKMVFSPPLSIGTESETEFLDLRLTERVDPQVALEAMNRSVTEDLRMLDAYYPDSKLTELRYLSYDIRIHTEGASEQLARDCERVLLAEDVPYCKKTKKGEALVNLRPGILDLSSDYREGDICLHALLDADPSSFLNPERLIAVLKSSLGILSCEDLTREHVAIVRTGAYRADRSEFR